MRILVEENMVKKLENWSHCIRIQQKKHIQKRTGTAKRSASMSKPIKIHPMRFLQQYVPCYLTGSHRCKEVMVNINEIQSIYNKLCLDFTIIISPRISYTLPHSENSFRQFHCYFVNNFTTAFVTFTSFIDNCGFLALFRSW